MSHAQEQKTIAKNTVFLYARMIVIMAISLYTSRVVLDKLGVTNYGIYNIVGSVVVSFTFVKNSVMSAIQRFLSFHIGNKGDVSSVFSISINVIVFFVIIVALLLETLGLWFFNSVLQIPSERYDAALITYHISVLTFCVNLLRTPYLSLIVANEKMSAYAVLGIIDAVTKLLIVYLLTTVESMDKLVLYAWLILAASLVDNILAFGFCKLKIKGDCKYRFIWDKKQFKDILSFTSWNLYGGATGVASVEGPNLFMNYYLGVGVNAAMGVAKQVNNAISGFFFNFQTAFNPQIVKSYAAGEKDYLFSLIFRTSKLSFYLLFVFIAPLLFCIDDVLGLWLTVVPEYSAIFCLLILLAQLVAAVSSPFWMTAHAIGNIKNYQLYLSIFSLAVIPISWVVLALGYEPYWILASQIALNFGVLVYRVEYLFKKIEFPRMKYYRDVVFRLFIVVPLLTLPFLFLASRIQTGFIGILVTSAMSVLVVTPVFLFVGFTKDERKGIISLVFNKLHLKRS